MPYDPAAWDAILEHECGAQVFHSSGWLTFLATSQGAEPVVAVVREHDRQVGYFVGAIVRRFGVRILGSPLKGWGTASMGFLLQDGVNRRAAADALVQFAFRDLGCLHIELVDSRLTPEQMAGSGYRVDSAATFIVDLEPLEDVVFGHMRRKTRQHIRNEIRRGLQTEIATDIGFADEFHAQLREVFARQGLAPTYGVERVRQLIQALQPTGQLLLVRVRAPNGETVATGIAVGRDGLAVCWGAVWLRARTDSNAIELLWWEMMRLERTRGARRFDCGGLGDYKAKYGGVPTPTFRFYRSRYPVLLYGRAAIRRLVRARQKIVALRNRVKEISSGSARSNGASREPKLSPPQLTPAWSSDRRRPGQRA